MTSAIGAIAGLPAHPLLVHAVVVLLPLAAAGGVASALSSRARSRVGWITTGFAVVSVVLIPLVTGSGESLQEKLKESRLIERHADMGEGLLIWAALLAIGLVALMVGEWWLHRTGREWTSRDRWVARGLVALVLVTATVSVVEVIRIGDSGAKATWSNLPTRPHGGG